MKQKYDSVILDVDGTLWDSLAFSEKNPGDGVTHVSHAIPCCLETVTNKYEKTKNNWTFCVSQLYLL